MRFSGIGAISGAILGAVGRGVVVFLNLGEGVPFVFLLPSAAIGIIVGAIAGGTGRPILGAVVGALLSGVVFEIFLLPCVSLIGTFGEITGDKSAQGEFLRHTFVYALEMSLAGLLAGGVGGWLGRRFAQPIERNEFEAEKRAEPTHRTQPAARSVAKGESTPPAP